MSLVGPRPHVPGFADRLAGPDRIVLSVRTGMTGPSSLAYRDEEAILATQPDRERPNSDVICSTMVRIHPRSVEQDTMCNVGLYVCWTLRGLRLAEGALLKTVDTIDMLFPDIMGPRRTP